MKIDLYTKERRRHNNIHNDELEKKDLNVMLNQMTQLRGKNRWQGS